MWVWHSDSKNYSTATNNETLLNSLKGVKMQYRPMDLVVQMDDKVQYSQRLQLFSAYKLLLKVGALVIPL